MTPRSVLAWIMSAGLLWTSAAGCARDTWRARPLEQLASAARRSAPSNATRSQHGAAQQQLAASQGRRPNAGHSAQRDVAQLEQQRCDAQCQAALVRWRMGDASGSRKILVDLLKRNPVHRDGNLLLAELYLLDQQPEKVVHRFQRLKDHHPGDAQLLHTLALALDAVGNRNEALAFYSQAVQLAPTDPDYEFSYEMAQAEAAKEAQSPEPLGPSSATSDRSLIAVYDRTSVNARPVSFAQKPESDRLKIKLNAVPPESLESTADSSSEDLASDEKDMSGSAMGGMGGLSALVESSTSLHKGGQAAHATPTDKSENPAGQGKSQLRLRSDDDGSSGAPALEEDAAVSDEDDSSAQAAVQLDSAAALLAAGDVVQAARHLRQAMDCSPEDIDVALSAGSAALRLEQPQLAAELLRSASVRFPESARLYRSLGTAYYRSGQYAAARLALRRSLSLDKSSALTYFLLGNTLRKLGHTSEADELLAQAARRDARFASLGQVRPVQ